jgi:DNA mismatch repair protein MutS
MYDEYLSHYTTYKAKFGPKVAIFLMVGVFYEMYDRRNAEGETNTSFCELADMLGLKVVVKKNEGEPDLLTAGLPDYAIHKWAARLTQLGWTVVIVDQVKNVSGKVTKREVTRILTPGSHVEAAVDRQDMYMTFVGLTAQQGQAPLIALTALDLTTGHLHVFETQAQGSAEAWTSNDAVQFMELYPPREVLWSTDGLDMSEAKLKQVLACPTETTFHRRPPLNSGAWLKAAWREEYLAKRCGLKTLLPTHVALHIVPGSNTETSLLSLLYALEELMPSQKLGSLLVYPWIPGTTMRLGENALVQLHMIVNDAKQDVLGIFDKCATPMGHRGIRERLLKPSADAATITCGLDAVEAWSAKSPEYKALVVKRMRTMSDVHRLFRKIQQGTVNANDIMGLDTTLTAAEWLASEEADVKSNILAIKQAIFKIFSADKCYESSDDTSLFVKGLVPALDDLEDKLKAQHERVMEFINTCARAIGGALSIAKDSFKAEFREKSLVIRGPRAAIQTLKIANKLPDKAVAVLNKTSSYIESPELDQIYMIISKYRDALRVQQSVSLIEHGSAFCDCQLVPWMRMADWITQADVNLTLERVAADMGYVRPTIVADATSSSVEIEGLRHPLLEAQDRKIPYVQHTVNLGLEGQQGWLLYGLNASGKSSLMRATGLAVLLAQGGSYVPASKMRLKPFASLHTRIVNTDNLWMGLSSFAVEMSEMRDIFREAGPRSLVLGDELCSGTETTSATALVAAGLRGLIKRGAKFLFATHLHGLAQIPEVSQDINLKIWHLHVEYDRFKDRLVYHRTLREGSGSALYGLEVAKAMRIPDDILEDAIRFRKRLAGEAELSTSVGSSWNSAVIRRTCESCGTSEADDLEVHHIKERHRATRDLLSDGSSVHARANLVVLCDTCHDSVHNGTLTIGPLVQTSDGLERSVTTTPKSDRKSKWSEE